MTTQDLITANLISSFIYLIIILIAGGIYQLFKDRFNKRKRGNNERELIEYIQNERNEMYSHIDQVRGELLDNIHDTNNKVHEINNRLNNIIN